MIFIVTQFPQKSPSKYEPKESYPCVVLMEDRWNDHGYYTACKVYVCLRPGGESKSVGKIRVMYLGQNEGKWVFSDGLEPFDNLDTNFCSLASNYEFYKKLKEIDDKFAIDYLKAIRDVSYNPKIWKLFSEDQCFQTSLLRDRSIATELRENVPKLFSGKRQRYVNEFDFMTRLPGANNDTKINFNFNNKYSPLVDNRVMLLVGINGAGKTQLLSNLAITLNGFVSEKSVVNVSEIFDKRSKSGKVDPAPSFYSVVAISFNAFDKFEIPENGDNSKYSYTYCGIRKDAQSLYSESDIIDKIQCTVDSMDTTRMETFLGSIKNILGIEKADKFLAANVAGRYKEMSAGQRLVLNILSHLVANLKKRTLVLIDEPETHLHPSLMTSLISEIFMLLEKYNSFAVIATHSPLIAQQIPSDSIRVISRDQNYVDVTYPDIECFGGSLSEISNALFEVREYERDYTTTIRKLLKASDYDPQAVEDLFPNGLGSNARVYLWATARGKKK